MNTDLLSKINRLNELFSKVESGEQLTNSELDERALIRDEIINYFKYATSKLSKKTE